MGRFARLVYVSNPKVQQYIGCSGFLEKNNLGGYDFWMIENELVLSTTEARNGAFLGDFGSPECKQLGFETIRGSTYQFDLLDR